jgi:hypothetical protein
VKLFGTVDSDDNRVEINPPGFQKPVETALILDQTGIKLRQGWSGLSGATKAFAVVKFPFEHISVL